MPRVRFYSFTRGFFKGRGLCASCGLILEENVVDLTQEWRAFDQEQRSKRARTGAPLTPTKHDKGMITEIGKGPGELFKVSPKKRAQYYRLRKWQRRILQQNYPVPARRR